MHAFTDKRSISWLWPKRPTRILVILGFIWLCNSWWVSRKSWRSVLIDSDIYDIIVYNSMKLIESLHLKALIRLYSLNVILLPVCSWSGLTSENFEPSCCGTSPRNLFDGSRALLFLNWLNVDMVENFGIEFCLFNAGEVYNEEKLFTYQIETSWIFSQRKW